MADNVLKAKIIADTSGFASNVDKATGSIEELRIVSKSLKAEIAGLDSQLRSSKGGKVLQAELKAVNSELKALERQAGISGAATGNALNKGFSGLKTIANILPGIGLAGLFGLIFEGVEKVITSLVELGNNLTPAERLADIMNGAAKKFVEASVSVSTLREEISLAKAGFLDKDKVVKAYNETIGKTTGLVSSLDQAEKGLNANADAYIRFTLLKAAANIALEKAAQKAFDAEQKRQKPVQEFNTIGSRASVFGVGQSSAPGFVPGQDLINEGLRARADAAEKSKKQAIKSAEDEKDELLKIGDDLLKQAADISKKFNFNFFGDNKEASKSFETEANKIISKAKELATFLNARSIRDIQFDVDPRDTLGESLKKAKEFIAKTKEVTANFKVKFNTLVEPVFQVTDPNNFKGLAGQTQDLRDKLEKEIDKLTGRNPILIAFKLKLDADKAAAQRLANDVAALGSDIKSAVGGAIEGLASSLGDALSGKNFAASIVNVIGDLVQQIGRALIKFAIVRGILDKVLKNPLIPAGAAFALGAAAVAIGQLIKNIKPVGARASGGGVNAGQGVLIGERGPEIFVPNSAGRIIPNNAIGGATGRVQPQTVQVTGEFVLRGTTLTAAITQALKSQNRLS